MEPKKFFSVSCAARAKASPPMPSPASTVVTSKLNNSSTADNPTAMTMNLSTNEITGNPIAARVIAPWPLTADPNRQRMTGSTN